MEQEQLVNSGAPKYGSYGITQKVIFFVLETFQGVQVIS
jgi:hypothetical protein